MKPTWSNENIDSILCKEGIPLSHIDVNNWALKRKDALIAIENLKKNNIAVLGGDIYAVYNGVIESTHDNWYCDRESGEVASDFILRSASIATNYINKYISETENVLIAIVPKAID